MLQTMALSRERHGFACKINIDEAHGDSTELNREKISDSHLPEESARLRHVLIYVRRASEDKQSS